MFDLNDRFPEFYKFHGRRISKKISKSNIDLIKNKFEQYSIDLNVINLLNKKLYNFNLTSNNNFEKIIIEVGFGNGEYLIDNAKKNKIIYISAQKFILMEYRRY